MVETITLESGKKTKVVEEQSITHQCDDCKRQYKKVFKVDGKTLCFFCYAYYGWYSNGASMPGPLELKEKQVKKDGTVIQRTESKAQQLLEMDRISKEQFEAFNTLYTTDRKKARKYLRKASSQYLKAKSNKPAEVAVGA